MGGQSMKKHKFTIVLLVLLLTACQANLEVSSNENDTSILPLTPSSEPVLPEYKVVSFDLELNEDSMKEPYGIGINSMNHIYVSDSGNDRVLVFDQQGRLISKWDQKGSEKGAFDTMGFGGLAIDSKDNVFVVDNNNYRVQKFDRDGNFISQWGSQGSENGQFIRAIGIAVDALDNVYVTDDGNPYIQKFDNQGNFLMAFGGSGETNGSFKHATGIAVDSEGNIFVADYENKNIQKFHENGTFIMAWQMENGNNVSGTPEGLAVDGQDNIYVTDYRFARIQVFDNEGNFLWEIDGKALETNLFMRPTSLAISLEGDIYVVNQASGQITLVEMINTIK